MATCEDLFRRGAITSRIQNDCGNWRLAFGVEMRVSSRSRRGQPERRNPANGSFRATKKAPAPPVCRPVDQLVTAELPVIRPELETFGHRQHQAGEKLPQWEGESPQQKPRLLRFSFGGLYSGRLRHSSAG